MGHVTWEDAEVDVGAIMAACHRLVADEAKRAGVDLALETCGWTMMLRADPPRLRQILLNLLSNAIKFTPAGGRVTLSAHPAYGGTFVLEVAATGIGMHPDDIPKALLPFHQIDGSHARRYQRTGLGLTLTKSLVELHGGTLTVDNWPDVGTTATVRLPDWRVMGDRTDAA